MSARPPLTEVVLVSRPVPLGRSLARLVVSMALLGAFGGAMLMLLLPLATETLGLRHLAPGYLTCAALVVLARLSLTAITGRILPTARGAA